MRFSLISRLAQWTWRNWPTYLFCLRAGCGELWRCGFRWIQIRLFRGSEFRSFETMGKSNCFSTPDFEATALTAKLGIPQDGEGSESAQQLTHVPSNAVNLLNLKAEVAPFAVCKPAVWSFWVWDSSWLKPQDSSKWNWGCRYLIPVWSSKPAVPAMIFPILEQGFDEWLMASTRTLWFCLWTTHVCWFHFRSLTFRRL